MTNKHVCLALSKADDISLTILVSSGPNAHAIFARLAPTVTVARWHRVIMAPRLAVCVSLLV